MSTLNILLLEDDAFDADIIIKTLERAGIPVKVQLAIGSDDFRALITHQTFDAILADNALPQFNATYALEIANELHVSVPFILVTGSMSEEYAVEMMKLGAWDYVLKDRLQRLPNALLSAVNKHQLRTERQKYLDDIIRKEALMREAEQLAHFGSWETDLVNHVDRWSDEYYRILGYAPRSIPASLANFLKHVHPDDYNFVKANIEAAMGSKDSITFNCRIITNDSVRKFLKLEVVAHHSVTGEMQRLTGIICDITETIRAQEKLMRSEANLHTIFDNTDTGYVLLDTHFRILSLNEPMAVFSREQLPTVFKEGGYILDFYPPEKQNFLLESLTEALSGKTVQYEIPYLQPDETNKWFATAYHPIGKNTKNMGVIIAQNEITSRKALELQEKMITSDLIQRKNELEQFTYIISHNLRAPVANILGLTNLIKDSENHTPETIFLTEELTNSVKKLDNIIIDLNEIIRVKRNVGDIKENVLLSELVDDIIYSIGNAINNKNIDFVCRFEVKSMFTIKSYMHSIFFNLISNSIKYRQPNSPLIIEIESRKLNNAVEFIFRDNGVGIDLLKKKDHIFGLYKRFHANLAEGKGMGLFMVKTHIEAMGGKIYLKSEVNKGTEFTVWFETHENSLATNAAAKKATVHQERSHE